MVLVLGEWEPHVGCWMAWPDAMGESAWRDGAGPAQQQHAAIAKAIAQFEPVTVFANAEVRNTKLKHTLGYGKSNLN